jgi:hypothetical protein
MKIDAYHVRVLITVKNANSTELRLHAQYVTMVGMFKTVNVRQVGNVQQVVLMAVT